MESNVYDSKCNRAFYSDHIDLKSTFIPLYISIIIVIVTFVILIDNTNF